jgi:hypothetical protein
MANLRDVSPGDPASNRALDGFEDSAPILQDLEFFQGGGDADRSKDGPGGNAQDLFRNMNEEKTAPKATRSYSLVPKRIVSFKSKADTVLEDRNESPEAELSRQTYEDGMEQGFKFQDAFFHADNGLNNKAFDGVFALASANGLVDTPSSGAIEVPLGNSDANTVKQQQAIEKLTLFLRTVNASHAYMPVALAIRFISIAKHLGYYRSVDRMGRQLDMIGNTVIRDGGFAAEQSDEEVIKFNETVNGQSNTASIVACRHAEGAMLTCKTSAGMKATFSEQGDFIQNSVNLDMTVSLRSQRALRQFKGWKLA